MGLLGAYKRLRGSLIEQPSFGWTTRAREEVLWLVFSYLGCSKLAGDYAEFGAWRGDTFATAYHVAGQLSRSFPSFRSMRFHAFDSFEGFPEPEGNDRLPIIQKGGRAYSLESFQRRMSRLGLAPRRMTATKGWFAETLQEAAAADLMVPDQSLAVAFVDCDLYESARIVLPYLKKKMRPGGVILFDNWYLYLGHPLRGEQRACREFLAANPEICLVPFRLFGWHGSSFLFHVLEPAEQSILKAQSDWWVQ